MNNYKSVLKIYSAPQTMMGDIPIRQAIPLEGLEQVSPFILLHHFKFDMPAGESRFDVPPHPHRGFSPITFMFEGAVEHNDSLGNNHVVHANEVQWINAGRGLIHSEKVAKVFLKKGGLYEGIQLWINVPREQKMLPATYLPITHNEIVLIEQKGVAFRLISGNYLNHKGPAHSAVFTAMLRMEHNSTFSIDFPANQHSVLYVLDGEVSINEQEVVSQYQFVVFEQTQGIIQLTATANAKLLLMSGEPINEPLVSYGPFVMTSQTEIMEAMRDYQQGKMGFLY